MSKLFEYDAEGWKYELCKILRHSIFAQFINEIGVENASGLKSHIIDADGVPDFEDIYYADDRIEIVARLSHEYVSGVRHIAFQYCVRSINIWEAEEEIVWGPLNELLKLPELEYVECKGFSRDGVVEEGLEQVKEDIKKRVVAKRMGEMLI